jgi:hypothetical protein
VAGMKPARRGQSPKTMQPTGQGPIGEPTCFVRRNVRGIVAALHGPAKKITAYAVPMAKGRV